jgi:hypothetical protein
LAAGDTNFLSVKRWPFKLGEPGSILGRTSARGLEIIEEKVAYYLYIDISKWLDFRVFSDKEVKIVYRYLGSPINWAIAFWEIRSPLSGEIDKQ